jgi:hypothetical protein
VKGGDPGSAMSVAVVIAGMVDAEFISSAT